MILYEELSKLIDEPVDIERFSMSHTGLRFGEISPYSIEDFENKKNKEIVMLLNDFIEEPGISKPTKDGLARTFSLYVRTNYEQILSHKKEFEKLEDFYKVWLYYGLIETINKLGEKEQFLVLHFTKELLEKAAKNDTLLIYPILVFIEKLIQNNKIDTLDKRINLIEDILTVINTFDITSKEDVTSFEVYVINSLKGKFYSVLLDFSLLIQG